ncbi:hypothetical protein ACS15_2201 [Ralstonia insidiosa]|uniref:Uncharacterized protein n=1 Tax=Ralstonia insidiosa TaxID=190721 RepID=A0AAC9BG08_9RALS|nr:hypothetical protein ACS15_2201 [Ralstonia insidiosa]
MRRPGRCRAEGRHQAGQCCEALSMSSPVRLMYRCKYAHCAHCAPCPRCPCMR